MKRGRGRPRKDKYEPLFMLQKIEEYVEANKNGIPIAKEVCVLNGWDYDHVNRIARADARIKEAMKLLVTTKEVNLEKGLLAGKLNPAGAIFSLKQLGWKDRPDFDTGEDPRNILEKLTEVLIDRRK